MMDGEDSPYADFFIERTDDGEDITEAVLNDSSYTFLLVAPHLEQADDSQLDELNHVYEYSLDHGYPFYCLTASTGKAISRWCDMTGAEYPFCNTDDITLKTVIRSNPGLLLLHNGVVIRKWSHNALPSEEELNSRLEDSPLGQLPSETVTSKILWILTWFVLPLVLLTLADRLWAWTHWIRKKKRNHKVQSLKFKVQSKTVMRKKIVAGNWKMNMNLQDGIALAKELNETLNASIAQFLDQDIIGLGAENCADKEKGAFTGEVSAEMVKSTGAQYVILGHSERREYYKEKCSTSLRRTSARSSSPTSPSGPSVPARPLLLSRQRRSTLTSAASSPRSTVRLWPTTPPSSMAVLARPATLPSCSQSPTSTVV